MNARRTLRSLIATARRPDRYIRRVEVSRRMDARILRLRRARTAVSPPLSQVILRTDRFEEWPWRGVQLATQEARIEARQQRLWLGRCPPPRHP